MVTRDAFRGETCSALQPAHHGGRYVYALLLTDVLCRRDAACRVLNVAGPVSTVHVATTRRGSAGPITVFA